MPAQSSNRNCSRPVTSNQSGIHEQLEKVVRRHLQKPFQRPYPAHAINSFKAIAQIVAQHQGPLIFDSFCGVGESSARIASQFPDALVIGIDKSITRLNKHPHTHQLEGVNNYQLVRADITDFWRLAAAAGWKLARHYLLYPNPWPKSSLFKHRVHGSPLFPSLLALGGRVEIRSNWSIYVEEFAAAVEIAGYQAVTSALEKTEPITPFERKYQQSNQVLWQCICGLD